MVYKGSCCIEERPCRDLTSKFDVKSFSLTTRMVPRLLDSAHSTSTTSFQSSVSVKELDEHFAQSRFELWGALVHLATHSHDL